MVQRLGVVRRSLRESVDRNFLYVLAMALLNCRSLRESVDRNQESNGYYFFTAVALYARAWIEISRRRRSLRKTTGRSLRENVDRNLPRACLDGISSSRSLRESVDRNTSPIRANNDKRVALYARAWIEIISHAGPCTIHLVALYARAWIEIKAIADYQKAVAGRSLRESVDRNF